MKKLFVTALLLSCAAWTAKTAAQTPVPAELPNLRVLVTYGNHDFEQPAFWAMMDKLPNVTWTKVDIHQALTACAKVTLYECKLPPEASILKPGLANDYDVVLRYDMVTDFPPAQQQAFLDLLNTAPGIGFLSLHHNLAAHSTWPEWKNIIGGKYVFADEIINRQQYRQTVTSGIASPIDLNIRVADPKHAITRGVTDYQTADELYNNIYLDTKNVHVLLTTDHPDGDRRMTHDAGTDPAMAWTKTYGASRVFYMRIGHHSDAWAHPSYQTMMAQGLRWAACGSRKQFC